MPKFAEAKVHISQIIPLGEAPYTVVEKGTDGEKKQQTD